MLGKLVRHGGETGFERFEVERTTLAALLRGSRAFVFAAGACAGLAFGFVLGIGAVAWW
jgi:hypothetical protein